LRDLPEDQRELAANHADAIKKKLYPN